ncbi:MAG: DUF4382 domain-containing protein [Chitinophagaceae bacterium]
MKHLFRICLGVGMSLLLFALVWSCKKEGSSKSENIPPGQQRLKIFLSDNPVNYDAVYVDIQQVVVQVIPDSCRGRGDRNHNDCYDDDEYDCSVWDTLTIRPGVYNLLDLSNGTDTLLANGLTLNGRINKIKLVLGEHNSVSIDSVSYPLTLWGNQHTVIINVRGGDIEEINPSDLQLWLDFDAGGSIVRVSNNHFVLKPRIRIWLPAQTSAIEGKVLPTPSEAVVSAVADGDTLIAIPDHHNGRFKIRGLHGSTADVFVNATAGNYRDTTITGVQLDRGHTTNVGTIQLHL